MTTVTRTSISLSPLPNGTSAADSASGLDASSPLGFEDVSSATSFGAADTFDGSSLARSPSPLSSQASVTNSVTKAAPSLDDVRSGSATMKLGMSGGGVRELQQRLNDAGAHPPLEVDGDFGPVTESALSKFQKNLEGSSLQGTKRGVLDQATLDALESCRVEEPTFGAASQSGLGAGLPAYVTNPAADTVPASLPAWSTVEPGALAKRIGDAAIGEAKKTDTVGWCAASVTHALSAAGVNDGAGDAYQKADELAADPRFTEVSATLDDLAKLPKGAVVVWGKGADFKVNYGHVSVATGDGHEASDHLEKQQHINGPGDGNTSDYGHGYTGHKFRVFIPTGE